MEQSEFKPDLVFIDMEMSNMDGEQLGQAIRKNSRFDHTLLILMTPLNQKLNTVRLKQSGFSVSFPKPIVNRDLLLALHALAESVSMSSALNAKSNLSNSEVHPSTKGISSLTKSAGHSLASFRLLLVKDNIINQEVALGILEGLGYIRADIAGNGVEALAALNNTPEDAPYHLILMDCQMPEMDGYEATRAIRAGKAPCPEIPIVAMTANAMKGDKENCLAAGMNDYISKPIDPEKLDKTLQRWLQVNQAQTIKEVEYMSEENSVIWDKEGFMKRIMNNGSIAVRLINLFKNDTPKTITQLEEAIHQEKAEEAGLLAHKLKGSVANLGGVELADLAKKNRGSR